MKYKIFRFNLRNMLRIAGVLSVAVLFLLWDVREVRAQAERKWLNIGDYHHQYSSTGAEPSSSIKRDGQFWPGLFKDRRHGTMVRNSVWIGTASHTDERGDTYAPRLAHAGPRTFGMDTPQEFFPKTMQLIGRFEKPEVYVDNLQSFDRAVLLTGVDPSMKAARMVVREANTILGVTMKNRVRAFGQQFHDDYHIHEYTFINTGNTDADPEIELPDQTLEGVYFYYSCKFKFWQGNNIMGHAGTNTMVDYFGDGMDPYEPALLLFEPQNTPFRAFAVWHGKTPWEEFDNLGTPVWTDDWGNAVVEGDSVGRLATAFMASRSILHADKSVSDKSNDFSQPTHTGFVRGGDPITNTNTPFNTAQMKDEYAYMSMDQTYRDYGNPGHEYPHHADIVAPDEPADDWYERMANQIDEPSRGHSGGWVPNFSFGPYTMAPGDSVTFIWLEGMQGLSREAAIEIGKAYKRSGGDDELLIEYQGVSHTKDRWVLSSRDSIFKMIAKATANLQSGYNIPHAPKPPKTFNVFSGPDRITLEWEVYEDADHTGFEIYRTRNRYQGAVEDAWKYEKAAELGPDARRYEDMEVQRGISYFYYIQSVGEVNNDNTGMTPTGVRLRSSRYYTQTYDPALLTRPPGEEAADARVVPNPYVLEADKNVRWPDLQDKIGFLEIPGHCTIKIYAEDGSLVETIDHTDGSGDEYWALTTYANQVVVSGLYIAVIEDKDSGETIYRKFVILR